MEQLIKELKTRIRCGYGFNNMAGDSLWKRKKGKFFFFFQAEDGIRDLIVTGSDVCSSDLNFIQVISIKCQWHGESERYGDYAHLG